MSSDHRVERVPRCRRRRTGAVIVEYALLLGLIASVCIGAVTSLGATVAGFFSAAASAIQAALDSGGDGSHGNPHDPGSGGNPHDPGDHGNPHNGG